MIQISVKSNLEKAIMAFGRKKNFIPILHKYGKKGVESLSDRTPIRTGKTAYSWRYEIKKTGYGYILSWHNDNLAGRIPIALLIQYGHATGTGGYVPGVNYINPAMKTVFEDLAKELRCEAKVRII